MQKRVSNVIRALVESDINPIISIHDHGAGGHLNCLSELVENTGGTIEIDSLPLGDPTLSAKEIIGNESQERMGIIISPTDTKKLKIGNDGDVEFYFDGSSVSRIDSIGTGRDLEIRSDRLLKIAGQ